MKIDSAPCLLGESATLRIVDAASLPHPASLSTRSPSHVEKIVQFKLLMTFF
jgi:hypothetical protein